MKARVLSVSTCTLAFRPTPTLPPPATPAATEVMSSSAWAFTSMSPSTSAKTPESMKALVSLLRVNTSAPTATPTEPATPIEPATETMSVSSVARTTTLPSVCVPFCTVRSARSPIDALVVSLRTLMVGATATATLLAAAPAAVMEMISSVESAATSKPELPAEETAVKAPRRA